MCSARKFSCSLVWLHLMGTYVRCYTATSSGGGRVLGRAGSCSRMAFRIAASFHASGLARSRGVAGWCAAIFHSEPADFRHVAAVAQHAPATAVVLR